VLVTDRQNPGGASRGYVSDAVRAGRPRAGAGAVRWFCYILECADGTLYTGITNSLDRRLALHNRGRASRYTRGRLPVRLLYAAPYDTRSSASRREREVKGLSRAKKLALGSSPQPPARR